MSSEPPTPKKPYRPPSLQRLEAVKIQRGSCPMCGWKGKDRNGEGRCVDYAACAHRIVLMNQGRPRDSACKCAEWPCPCVCHQAHGPEIWLAVVNDERGGA